MTKQIELTRPLELLDAEGHITTEGSARQPYWNYRRKAIRASVVLDDGTPIAVDRLLGFAEDVLNWW